MRERGYFVLAAEPDLLQRHRAALFAFEQPDRLPRHERAMRQVTSELAELLCPDLMPGERYDLASIVVLLPTAADLPPMALRMTGLPSPVPTEQIETWVASLKRIADAAARR